MFLSVPLLRYLSLVNTESIFCSVISKGVKYISQHIGDLCLTNYFSYYKKIMF